MIFFQKCRTGFNQASWLLNVKKLLAFALFLALSFGGSAHASDYGCKVLLCLSNPSGPTAVSECVPPISQLWDDLAHFRAFPTCDMADGNDGSAYARPVVNAYDPCPPGTSEAQQGAMVVQGMGSTGRFILLGKPGMNLPGNECDGGCGGMSNNQGPLACVGNPVGTYHVGGYGDDASYDVLVYDQLVWQQPKSPNAIDVFIDSALYRRVRL